MFVEASTTVMVGLPQVEKTLDAIRGDLVDLADVAYRDGEQLSARVGPGGSVAKHVTMEIGIPEIHVHGLVYPVSWQAAGATMLFPELDAELILEKKGPEKTGIRLRGTYQPPMGPVGRVVDRILLHRVAKATIDDWMERLGASLSLANWRRAENGLLRSSPHPDD